MHHHQPSRHTEDGSSLSTNCPVSAACRSAGKTVAVQMLNVEAWNIQCSDPGAQHNPQSSLNCRQQTLVQQPAASMLHEEERNANIIDSTTDQFRSVGAEILIGCWVLGGGCIMGGGADL